MTLPPGDPTFDRVVAGMGDPLAAALDRSLTGYAEVVPQAALLLDADGQAVLWFEDGLPTHATHTRTGARGTDVLAELAATGPYRVRLVPVAADRFDPPGDGATLSPAAPAERLAGEDRLAERTRDRADLDPAAATDGDGLDAVEAFLEDDEKIRAIRDRARAEAKRTASEWNLGDLGSE
ncbi:MAG: hypothetical protein ABEJ59_02270 [Halanaeroarchaeum sp.]